MKILHVLYTLNSRDGGPTRSVSGLCSAQVDLGNSVTLLCKESDLFQSNSKFLVNSNLGKMSNIKLKQFCLEFDCIHIHGIWVWEIHRFINVVKSIGVRIFISPRGMLQEWALKHKRVKKLIAWFAYQRSDLLCVDALFVTAEIERRDAIRVLPNARILLLPNGVENQGYQPKIAQRGKRRALFLSRINVKKGIQDLIAAWSDCSPKDWELIVAGPDSEGLWKSLEKSYQMNDIGVKYIGEVDGKIKADLYRSAEVFLFPTYSENFGLVVTEALSSGTPVLTTTGTPWTNLPSLNCGWCISPGVNSVKEILPKILSCGQEELAEMGRNGVKYVQANFNWTEIAKRSIELYTCK